MVSSTTLPSAATLTKSLTTPLTRAPLSRTRSQLPSSPPKKENVLLIFLLPFAPRLRTEEFSLSPSSETTTRHALAISPPSSSGESSRPVGFSHQARSCTKFLLESILTRETSEKLTTSPSARTSTALKTSSRLTWLRTRLKSQSSCVDN